MSDQLLDDAALIPYLKEHLGHEGDVAVTRHQAGHSNESFFVDWGDRRYVLRRPPLGAFLPSAHDVRREFRVLSALADTPVRTPRPVFLCEDESVIGAPFYLMERVDGVVVRTELPEWLQESERAKVGDELVDALVELHAVEPASCGLDDWGRPTGYLERQLKRWSGQIELTLPFTRPLPDLQEIGAWLGDNLPESPPSTIVHGDYKLDNVMLGLGPPARVVAILDWEMSTIGDPLADLGWMISFWTESRDPSDDIFSRTSRVTTSPGFQKRSDLIERYAAATGRDVSNLSWYVVLAVWKLAILLEGSYARHLAGMTDDPFFAELKDGVPALARRGLELTQS